MYDFLKIITEEGDDSGICYLEVAIKIPFYLTLSSGDAVREFVQEFILIASALTANTKKQE